MCLSNSTKFISFAGFFFEFNNYSLGLFNKRILVCWQMVKCRRYSTYTYMLRYLHVEERSYSSCKTVIKLFTQTCLLQAGLKNANVMLLSWSYLQICGVLFQFVLFSSIIVIGYCYIRLYNMEKNENKQSKKEADEIKQSFFADLPARQAETIFTKAIKPPYVEAN